MCFKTLIDSSCLYHCGCPYLELLLHLARLQPPAVILFSPVSSLLGLGWRPCFFPSPGTRRIGEIDPNWIHLPKVQLLLRCYFSFPCWRAPLIFVIRCRADWFLQLCVRKWWRAGLNRMCSYLWLKINLCYRFCARRGFRFGYCAPSDWLCYVILRFGPKDAEQFVRPPPKVKSAH